MGDAAWSWLVRWCDGHLEGICAALLATTLAIYGQDLNRAVRRRLRRRPLLIRLVVFVAICAFGYGWLVVVLSPRLAQAMRLFPAQNVPVAIALAFTGLGILAERNRKI